MVRISDKPLKREVFLAINKQFTDYLVRAKTKQETKRLISELLTNSEKTMLAKRLALILMLERGHNFSTIRKNLKMSQSTIARLWKDMKNDKFIFIAKDIRKEKKKSGFWVDLEGLVKFRVPAIAGKGRWRGVLRKA